MTLTRKTWRLGGVGLATLCGWLLAAPLPAQERAAPVPSLGMVPADAGMYSAMLRNKEQIDAVLKSKAWARLNALPFVKMGWQKLEEEWKKDEGPLAEFRKWYEQPGNADIIRFLGEMFSDEVFVYGGKDSADLIQLMQDLQMANQFGPLALMLKDGPQAAAQPGVRVKILLQTLADKPERLKIPDLVMGFRLGKTPPEQVDKWVKMAEKALVGHAPQLKGHLKKAQVHGAVVHTITLDGATVPWEQLLGQVGENAGDYEKLIKRLKEMKFTLGITVRDNYLLVSLGEGLAGLKAVGAKLPGRLAGRPEMAPLAKFADRPLTAVGYVSKEFQTALAGDNGLGDMGAWLGELIKDAGLPAEKQEKLKKDLKALAADLKRVSPEPGAALSFSFLTKRGAESYEYDWTKNHGLDASRPLTMLEHVGNKPLAFVASRERGGKENYQLLVKFVKLAHEWVEDLAVPMLPEQPKQLYEDFMKEAKPLFARLDKATLKYLIPSLDGQAGVVFDARLTAKQWHNMMPAAEKDLPLPELALILGVQDAAKFRKAFQEYREIFNGLADVVRKLSPIDPGDIHIPEPDTKRIAVGTLYSYKIPAESGLDPRIMPTGGLSDSAAVFTLTQEQAKHLLSTTTWKSKEGPLSDPKRPMAAAAYLNWAGVVDAAAPWVDYALDQTGTPKEVADQVRTVVQVLKVFRSFQSATYIENGVVVTHAETIVRDLEK
jgi:hypothetical protein